MAGRLYGLYAALLGLSASFALATLIPNPNASWECIMGYKSLCTFAPMATALCALAAGATCVFRARIVGPQRGERRSWVVPVAIALILAAIVAASLPFYIKAKRDAVSGATQSAGIAR